MLCYVPMATWSLVTDRQAAHLCEPRVVRPQSLLCKQVISGNQQLVLCGIVIVHIPLRLRFYASFFLTSCSFLLPVTPFDNPSPNLCQNLQLMSYRSPKAALCGCCRLDSSWNRGGRGCSASWQQLMVTCTSCRPTYKMRRLSRRYKAYTIV